jgi:hypothetical protein
LISLLLALLTSVSWHKIVIFLIFIILMVLTCLLHSFLGVSTY